MICWNNKVLCKLSEARRHLIPANCTNYPHMPMQLLFAVCEMKFTTDQTKKKKTQTKQQKNHGKTNPKMKKKKKVYFVIMTNKAPSLQASLTQSPSLTAGQMAEPAITQ